MVSSLRWDGSDPQVSDDGLLDPTPAVYDKIQRFRLTGLQPLRRSKRAEPLPTRVVDMPCAAKTEALKQAPHAADKGSGASTSNLVKQLSSLRESESHLIDDIHGIIVLPYTSP